MSSLRPRLDPSGPTAAGIDPPSFGPPDEGRIVSSAEFAAATFAEPWVYERVVGRLVVMSPDSWEHVSISEPWRDRLGAYALVRPDLVRRVVSQAWVRIDAGQDRIGDIGVYLTGNPTDLSPPELIPDLMFEFVSPSKLDRHRDYVLKRAEYERVGVREYVIVDRFDQRVTVLSREPEGYAERILAADETYESPLLPGFAVWLAEVWPR